MRTDRPASTAAPVSGPAQAPPVPPAARAALLACVGAGFATLLDSAVVAYTAPALGRGIAESPAILQWYLAAYSLTFGLGLVPAGRLGDAFGRRRPMLVGLLLFLLGALVSALGPSAVTLVAGRLVQGLGAGAISAQVLGLIQDHFGGIDRIRALGAYSAAGAAAAIAGPLLAGAALGALPADAAWRAVLLLPVPFVAATMWLVARRLPAEAPLAGRPRPALDLPGIGLTGALVVIVTIPVIDPGIPGPRLVAAAAAVLLLALLLVLWERRYARTGRLPLFAPPLMRRRGYLLGNLVALLWFGAVLAAGTVLTVHLLQALAVPPLVLALVMLPGAFARLLAARLSSRTYARVGPRIVALGMAAEGTGMLLTAGAALLLAPVAFVAVAAVLQLVQGVCSGLSEPSIRALVLAHAPEGMAGVAASFLQLTQRLAATLMIALGTGLLLLGGTGGAGLALVLGICAACVLAAGGLSLSRSFRGSARGAMPRPR
ncbi:MFS transporter [Leucobacter allii]|uniref:MFS transporter n=1 Tax=Leucobacter allii TaxID=2932247 RepID=A0ABY4FLK1_9MICO|nr:MFS transporter [Leucobacter allii]UOQ57128.1 MFS transporter [Leucobacter allii]